jgi:hypothetical protein
MSEVVPESPLQINALYHHMIASYPYPQLHENKLLYCSSLFWNPVSMLDKMFLSDESWWQRWPGYLSTRFRDILAGVYVLLLPVSLTNSIMFLTLVVPTINSWLGMIQSVSALSWKWEPNWLLISIFLVWHYNLPTV